jgi:hypothetical protein
MLPLDFHTQIALDPHSLVSINMLILVGVMFPERRIQAHVTMCGGWRLVDDP